jgi:enoyl-CoA hydratase/carnithine racemase
LYLSQTVDAREAYRLGMVNRVVPGSDLESTAELIAAQIAQAPLSVLMGIKAGVKRAREGMDMRVHVQSHLQVMEAVGRAGDVAMWREENAAKGYGTSPPPGGREPSPGGGRSSRPGGPKGRRVSA